MRAASRAKKETAPPPPENIGAGVGDSLPDGTAKGVACDTVPASEALKPADPAPAPETQPAAEIRPSPGTAPLDYILEVMRDSTADTARRDEMAKLALPYMHAKPVATEQAPGNRPPEPGKLTLLEAGRRIAFVLGAVSRAEEQTD